MSVAAGPELGKPRFDNTAVTIPNKQFSLFGYSIIGVGAAGIYRVDANYSNRASIFIAGTVHGLRTFNQQSCIGTQPGRTIVSAELSFGVGVNIGQQNR